METLKVKCYSMQKRMCTVDNVLQLGINKNFSRVSLLCFFLLVTLLSFKRIEKKEAPARNSVSKYDDILRRLKESTMEKGGKLVKER